MRPQYGILPVLAMGILAGCSDSAPKRSAATAPVEDPAPSITQLYTTVPQLARGEKAMICYGVENARSVWLEPPKQELSAALSRCVEVSPEADTTYKLTAEGAGGKTTTRELKIAVGAGRPKIVNVTVSAIEVNPGDLVNICWDTANVSAVNVMPMKYRGQPNGCVSDQPRKSTTYVVTASGAGGERDEEKVSVKVR